MVAQPATTRPITSLPRIRRFLAPDSLGHAVRAPVHGDSISEGDTVGLPDGRSVPVVEVYDDEEHGKEGGVASTLVVDDGSVPEQFL